MQSARKNIAASKEDTRVRLLVSAAAIFAEVGYHAATTRDICLHAGANVAAVNYHFGDKLGLYTEVLRSVVATSDLRQQTPTLSDKRHAEALFRAFVSNLFNNMTRLGGTSQYLRLMAHELANPTPGLDIVVEKIVRPNSEALCIVVAHIIGRPAHSSTTRLCAQSVIAQILHYFLSRPVMRLLWPGWDVEIERRAAVLEHITEFSLAGLRHAGKRPKSRAVPGRRPGAKVAKPA